MGYLLLAGGAEFGGRMAIPDKRALFLAGGPDARLSIIPAAAAPDNNHQRAGRNGLRWFQSLGATNVALLSLIDRESADAPKIVASLKQSKLIYLLGGFPHHLGQSLAGSLGWQSVLEAHRAGAVIAGSSAGAMVLCDYYYHRFQVDTRGVRFPGLISYVAPPGGGTTDYAVEIFHDAIRYGRYTCFLGPQTRLDMMYMPDALAATIGVMEADPERLVHRNSFNITAMNFTPEELAAAIRRHLPDFAIDYQPDPVRQAIADSWPESIDDSAATEEWGWKPAWDLDGMTKEMLDRLSERLRRPVGQGGED